MLGTHRILPWVWSSYLEKSVETKKGYKNVVIHVSLLQILHDGILCDLGEQDHVIHAAVLNIVALPVVPVGTFASLGTENAQ